MNQGKDVVKWVDSLIYMLKEHVSPDMVITIGMAMAVSVAELFMPKERIREGLFKALDVLVSAAENRTEEERQAGHESE